MNLHLRTIQSQALSGRQIQSLEILGMGWHELQMHIDAAFLENPVLDISGMEHDDTGVLSPVKDRECHGCDRDGETEDGLQRIAQPDEGDSLYDDLLRQLRNSGARSSVAAAVLFVIESLDENGYLDEDVRQLAALSGYTVTEIRDAVGVVQGFEPAGVGARDLPECLSLQLVRLPHETELAQAIVQNHLAKVAACQYAQIAKATGSSEELVRRAVKLIASLHPKPGLVFSGGPPAQYVRPDVIVTRRHGEFEVLVNEWDFPNLRISRQYTAMMRHTSDEEVRAYLEGKLESARRLISCIAQRRSTLIQCAEVLLKEQRAFFGKGCPALKPLNMSLAAQRMGLHVSTVSRAIKNKYLQCDFGIYPISYFFANKLAGPEEVSGDQARHLIKDMIAGEDRGKPFSDREIAERLGREGVAISRRTVAKYRGELNIFGAAQRRLMG